MEGKSEKKGSLTTIVLIFALIVIVFMGLLIYRIGNEKNSEAEKVKKLEEQVKNLTIEDSSDEESKEKNNSGQIENIEIDSKLGKEISEYLSDVWVGPVVYKNCMAEFEDIKSAPKDYLAACASFKSMSSVGEDIYNAKTSFSEFNDTLVELFGDEADGLISDSDIEKVFFVVKNSDGTYHFSGFDGSEISDTIYIISKIEKQGSIFTVTQYEYEVQLDEMTVDLTDGQSTQKHIYDRNRNLIVNTTIKAIQDGNITSYKEYDEDGKEIDSIDDLLLSKYADKLSVRIIKLEYDSSDNSFRMVSNELG